MQQLIAGSTTLDLEKLVSVPLIFRIADIRDISKKSAAYSKTVVLPGTNVNNKFFGGLYDFNSDFKIFNPNVKTPCLFSLDGDEFIRGFLQLKTITRNDKGEINYNTVLYDSLVDFWADIGKEKLEALNFTALNHIYRKADIEASWLHTWTDGYYYPMLFNNQSLIKTTDFKPAIFEKYLLDKIITDAGFTWSGNLKTDPQFEKEVIQNEIPANISIDPLIAETKTFRAEKTAIETIYTNLTSNMSFGTGSGDLLFTTDDEVTPPNDDSNNLWDAVNKFAAPVNGMYQFKASEHKIKISINYTSNFASNQNPDNAFLRHRLRCVIKNALSVVQEEINVTVTSVQTFLPIAPFGVPQNIVFNETLPATTVTSVVTGNRIYMEAGWTAEFFIDAITWALNFPKTTVNSTKGEVLPGSFISSEKLLYSYTDNIPLVFSDFVNKKFEQKKVILDVIARYNCFVYTNPEDEKDIVFNIRDEFYATAPVLDWTDKKDFDSKDEIKMIAELQSEELLLTYKKGGDNTNKGYTESIGDDNIFGQFKYVFGNEFVKGKKKIESPFSPTPLVKHGAVPGMIVPAIHSREDLKGDRLLYNGGVIEVATVTWSWQYRDGAGALQTATMNGYPYAGHYDHPIVPTIDINFGGLPFPSFFYNPTQTTGNNLFSRYWQNTIDQIADGRLVISKFDLTSADVFFIKNNPNTKLFIENTYYYINKIEFEANEDLKKLTKIELLTVEDELTFDFPIPIELKEDGDVKGDFGHGSPPNKLSDNNNDNPGDMSNETNGVNNTIGEGSFQNSITGDNNFIDTQRSGNTINGNGNRIFGSNITIIGTDNLTVRGNYISVINGIVTKGCLQSVFFNAIDGGIDEVRTKNATCNINKVCSELDGESDLFNVSLFNLINSEDGIPDEITDFFNQV